MDYLRYTSLAIQMLVIIIIGAAAGTWLDKHFGTSKPYFTASLSLVFVFIAIYFGIRDFISPKKE
jgi:uncharacterized membrane protein YfcA